jgi:hypothetical protein
LFAFIEYFSLHPTYRHTTSYQLQDNPQEVKVGPLHYLFTKNFIPNQPETRVLRDLELTEEEIAGEDLESI